MQKMCSIGSCGRRTHFPTGRHDSERRWLIPAAARALISGVAGGVTGWGNGGAAQARAPVLGSGDVAAPGHGDPGEPVVDGLGCPDASRLDVVVEPILGVQAGPTSVGPAG